MDNASCEKNTIKIKSSKFIFKLFFSNFSYELLLIQFTFYFRQSFFSKYALKYQ